jgi:uncharacterized repeat protein (TIGR03803 family)
MTNIRNRLIPHDPIQAAGAGKKPGLLKLACILSAFCIAAALVSPAQTFTNLVNFDLANGAFPYYGSLITDSSGNLYGTTVQGGSTGLGTVFKVTPSGELTTLYSFCLQNNCTDGLEPYGALVLGPDGNFYGTTAAGGTNFQGTAFQLTPEGVLTTIYNFCSQALCADGGDPFAGLTVSSDGTLYGTTNGGGTNAGGTIFSLTTSGTLTVLHNFCSATNCADGNTVYDALAKGSNGTFYGVTLNGGTKGWGTVFSITPAGKFTTLHTFSYTDGATPWGGLIQAKNGNLYGTTAGGGKTDSGTVFQIAKGNKFTTIYNFCVKTYCADGVGPVGNLIQGSNGNFFGTTEAGGIEGWGTAFEVTSTGTLKTLHSFERTDGTGPFAGLVQDSNGTFYGTTYEGGDLSCSISLSSGCGTVFSIAP